MFQLQNVPTSNLRMFQLQNVPTSNLRMFQHPTSKCSNFQPQNVPTSKCSNFKMFQLPTSECSNFEMFQLPTSECSNIQLQNFFRTGLPNIIQMLRQMSEEDSFLEAKKQQVIELELDNRELRNKVSNMSNQISSLNEKLETETSSSATYSEILEKYQTAAEKRKKEIECMNLKIRDLEETIKVKDVELLMKDEELNAKGAMINEKNQQKTELLDKLNEVTAEFETFKVNAIASAEQKVAKNYQKKIEQLKSDLEASNEKFHEAKAEYEDNSKIWNDKSREDSRTLKSIIRSVKVFEAVLRIGGNKEEIMDAFIPVLSVLPETTKSASNNQ
ncbi:unnamed protein product [Caenorhabditis angaria]|uniref:Uncharacterized protein n=1 Tax=Caenorhabditis angaria TaxID=860376 RepID=A0A9P1MVZ4_9PELO|nr:unnamed protein product [Caenorhabditis angaria]